MARYEILFLDSAGKVTATEEFIAGLEIDENRIAPLIARACGDEYSGFELWQGNRLIAGCRDALPPEAAGNSRAATSRLLGPVSASPRPLTRSLAIAATLVLALGAAIGVASEHILGTDTANAVAAFRQTEIGIAATIVRPEPRGAGPSEAIIAPPADTAQNDAMLQALANYQRHLLETSAAEETAGTDRTVAAPKARTRRRPVRARAEIRPPDLGPQHYDYRHFPGYGGR